MYTKSLAIINNRPEVSPWEAGKVHVSDGSISAAEAELAVGGLVGLCILPAMCVPLDFALIVGDLDTGAALTQSVGVLNSAETDLVADTAMIVESTIGQGGGIARATIFPIVAPVDYPRVIAVKSVTGGVLPVKATGTITSSGVQVTAADTVTINGKVYTFVSPIGVAEGNVLIGADANASLANLFLAINRQDPITNDGVKYKVAAAHPTVAGITLTPTVLTLESRLEGAGGNAYTLAKVAATYTVNHDHLGGAGGILGVTAVPLQGGSIRGILRYRAEEWGA